MNVNFEVMKGAANFAYANGFAEQSAAYFEKALEFQEEPRVKLYAGIAYYKAGKLKKKKSYLEKAMRYLKEAQKGIEEKEEAGYYLTLIYSELGDVQNAAKEFKMLRKGSLLRERAVITSLDSMIYVKAKEAEELRRTYALLDDPLLLELFNIIYPYIRGTDIEERLNKKHASSGAQGFALELKRVYEEEFSKKGNPFVKLAKIAVKTLRGEDPSYIKLLNKEELKLSDLDALPVMTRNIVKELMKKFGGKEEGTVKIPFIIGSKLDKIKHIAKTYSMLEKMSKKELVQALREVGGKKMMKYRKELEEGLPIDKMSLKKDLWKEMKEQVRELLKIIGIFYYGGKEKQLLKLLLGELPLPNERKVELFLEV